MQANSQHGAVLRAIVAFCRDVESPYANSIANALEREDFQSACNSQIEPSAYQNPYVFAKDYAAYNAIRKYSGSGDEQLLTAKAVASFKETEIRVRDTNDRLRFGAASRGVEGVIETARRKIARMLGQTESRIYTVPWDRILEDVEWGKGATQSLQARDASLDNKILEPSLSVTPRCLKYARALLTADSTWMSARMGAHVEACCPLASEFQLVPAGRFATVPKDWKSRRSIDIQPTMNLYLQKGVGSYLRRLLKRDGINLDDQSRNQSLAARAQKDSYATIDLASASDTIATELVRLLLPPALFEVLDDLRTHRIHIADDPLCPPEGEYLHKFSAMGNGFTFELESLIFYALCWAVVRMEAADDDSDIAVYGDDIIVAQCHASRVIEVLNECGFVVNDQKSFTSGRFFESCGKHYFDGVDVTPFYQKEMVTDVPSAIRFANRLFRWAARVGGGYDLDGVAFRAWVIAYDTAIDLMSELNSSRERQQRRLFKRRPYKPLPMPLQPWYVEGDDALISEYHNASCNISGQLTIITLSAVSKKVRADDYALYATSLRRGCVVSSAFHGYLPVRGVVSYEIRRRQVSRQLTRVPSWYFSNKSSSNLQTEWELLPFDFKPTEQVQPENPFLTWLYFGNLMD